MLKVARATVKMALHQVQGKPVFQLRQQGGKRI